MFHLNLKADDKANKKGGSIDRLRLNVLNTSASDLSNLFLAETKRKLDFLFVNTCRFILDNIKGDTP